MDKGKLREFQKENPMNEDPKIVKGIRTMGRKRKKPKDEQLDLIDVQPENAKEIIKVAREYKEAQRERLAWLKSETDSKQQLLSLVKEAKLKPLEGGVIRFKVDGVLISVTPRDELVKVKEDDEPEEE